MFEFPDVCAHFIGPIGQLIAGIFGVLSFLGALLAYWVYMSTFLKSIGEFVHHMVGIFNLNNQLKSKKIFQGDRFDPDRVVNNRGTLLKQCQIIS